MNVPLTQAQFAYNELRRHITSGQLFGDAHIVQSEWAERLNISITPVREAIRRLEQDGLAKSEAHKGTTVIGMSIDRAREIHELRCVLDPMQIRRADGALAGTVDEASGLCLRMSRTDDPVEFCDLDLEFHRIVMGIDDSWTARIARNLTIVAAPYLALTLHADPGRMDKENGQHEALVDALSAPDLDRYLQLHLAHITETFEQLGSLKLPVQL